METTTVTTFTTRPEAAARIASIRQFPEATILAGLASGQTYMAGSETFTDNGAGMVKVEAVAFSMTRDEWSRKSRDYRTGDPRKGTARVLTMTDRGTCLVPVVVHG